MTKKIEFTDQAKEQIEKIISNDKTKKYFRISVKGGGCSGFKYNFSFENNIDKDDILFEKVVIDKSSLEIIAGSIVGLLFWTRCEPAAQAELTASSLKDLLAPGLSQDSKTQ